MTDYYHRRHLPAFSSIRTGQAELAERFFSYYGAVFEPGDLSKREKSLAALAVAHVVQCPYCIDAYTSGSLEAGADLEELTEAIHLAAMVRANSTLSFGMQALEQARYLTLTGNAAIPPEGYYHRRHVDETQSTNLPSPMLYEKSQSWKKTVTAEGALEPATKAAIWLACAHAIQCPYAIDDASRHAKQHGLSLTAMTETVHIAAAIRGGASLIHGLQMLEQVQTSSM